MNIDFDLKEVLRAHADWLKNAGGKRADLSGCDLRGALLAGFNLCDAIMCDTRLEGAVLTDANMQRANLQGANLSHALLNGSNFSAADMRWCTFVGCDFGTANMHGANMCMSILNSASLFHADLSGTYLIGANFASAGLYQWASVAFSGHRTFGYTLLAYRQRKNSGVAFTCGRFHGSQEQFRASCPDDISLYALDVVLALLEKSVKTEERA